MNPKLEAHLRSLVSFPSPPGVATHIIELARDPDIEMGKVAKALSLDSALAIKVLRIANSPLYAQRRKSENLRQALVVLGLNATLTLALSFSLVKSLRSHKPNGISFPYYWQRALLAATAARALADAMRHPMAEEIFLAALLQDVGMLALDQAMPHLYQAGETLQRDHAALVEHEKKGVQTDHAQVGGWLMRTWNLPERLHVAISRSHDLDLHLAVEPSEIFDRCVALSGLLADLFLLKPEQREFAATAQTAHRCLGLDKMTFGQVLATMGSMIPDTEAIFETDLLADHHWELIQEQARELLMLRNLQALREINTLRAAAECSNSRAFELEQESRRDALTGICNRAHLEQVLMREFENSTRQNLPLSLAFADLDHFKRINDRFGHQAGDRILEATARILRGNTRESDLVARYDGEEFLVVLPATEPELALVICNRIVAAFANAAQVIAGDSVQVTISIGCATHGTSTSFTSVADFIMAADQALHVAKMRGRNRSIAYDRQNFSALAAASG